MRYLLLLRRSEEALKVEVRVKLGIKLKSLILAQIERWRHA